MSMEMSQHVLKQLEEKDFKINQLSDYVAALKKDLALLHKNPTGTPQRSAVSSHHLSSIEGTEQAPGDLRVNEQIHELQSVIYTLQAENSKLEERARRSA